MEVYMDQYLNVKEVAAMLHLAPFTVRKLARTGKLPSYKIAHKFLFVHDEIIQAMEDYRC
jgi:excisionase family DNA binding protein